MTKAKICFADERNGYSKGQVDGYVAMIGEEYGKLYDAYQSIKKEYERSLEDFVSLHIQEREQTGSNTETIVNFDDPVNKVRWYL